MPWAIGCLLLASWALVAASPARGDRADPPAQVRVVDSWPRGDNIALGRNGHFYLRLGYRTNHPVGIWVRGYAHGEPAAVGTSPSLRYDGEGTMLAWLFLLEPGAEVDEIRITAGDGSLRGTPVVATLPVHLSDAGGSNGVDALPRPAWVDDGLAHQQAAQHEAARQAQTASGDGGGAALVGGLLVLMLVATVGGLGLPIWACWRWRGGWRLAAALPAAVVAFVVLRIVVDVAHDPTSHNLWPFELVLAGLPATLATGVMVWLRRVGKRA